MNNKVYSSDDVRKLLSEGGITDFDTLLETIASSASNKDDSANISLVDDPKVEGFFCCCIWSK